jgi:hypothetical protein
VLAYVIQTYQQPGFYCPTCEDHAILCCPRKGHAPATDPVMEQVHRGKVIGRLQCPTLLRTPAHDHLYRLWIWWKQGRPLYPSLMEHPARLMRQFEVIDVETAALAAEGKSGA